jgi:hypothetical protein
VEKRRQHYEEDFRDTTKGEIKDRYNQQNTELTAGRINWAKDKSSDQDKFIVLQSVKKGRLVKEERLAGKDFLAGTSTGDRIEISKYLSELPPTARPILRLNMVDKARRNEYKDASGFSASFSPADFDNRRTIVPYLEYQLLTKQPVADVKALVIGSVSIEGIKRRVRQTIGRFMLLVGGFVLENF